jgi:hypothetical protein
MGMSILQSDGYERSYVFEITGDQEKQQETKEKAEKK